MPEILGVGVLWAFLAGLVSFLSPCVLPLVPGYVSYVAGQSLDDMTTSGFSKARLTALALSGSFVFGFSTVFITLGASATAIGQLFRSYRSEADLVAGAVVTLFGLHMTGVLRLGFLNRDIRFHGLSREGTVAGAFVLGAAFAFGWTPCIGPILGSILTLSMATSTISGGMTLLAIYSLGLAVPFLLVAAFTSAFVSRLRGMGRAGRIMQVVSGGLLALVGIAMMMGYLGSMGTWMLNAFPFFQKILL